MKENVRTVAEIRLKKPLVKVRLLSREKSPFAALKLHKLGIIKVSQAEWNRDYSSLCVDE